ncbi:hypothetical protein BD779DRAFT_1680038 [Infundibulicybe gibba]|nr:hypothetical protein BD779DRAFT_1680038 [Infundibulicybe gibba]
MHLRSRIAREMDSEFAVCDLDTFRRSYLPFNPSEEDIQRGLQTLRDRGKAIFDARNNLQWENFMRPSRCGRAETRILNSLQDVFDALTECQLSGTRASCNCNFVFRNHPDIPLSADISEYNHRIDGSFIQLNRTSQEDWKAPREISSADVGVSVEFRTNKSDDGDG